LRDKQVRSLSATRLITPTTWEPANLGPEGARLADVLARLVTITDINDERSFYDQFAILISQAQNSIWLWSAWVASRVRTLLPLHRAAVDRGVRVTVFVRDPNDSLQQKKQFTEALASLRTVVPNVVEVHVTHEEIVVIDDHTIMLGSLNALSRHRSREVMITMRGSHWARKLLTDLHAEEFSSRRAAEPAKASKWTSVARLTVAVGIGGATTRPAGTVAEAGTECGPVQ
jgi:phosphatidylserine/phosphatidylglycerophosphate/cardiolipin synthase-like enzyme